MNKLTSTQYNIVDNALGHTGYLNMFEDRRAVNAMLRKGFIERSEDSIELRHGFCLKLTIDGIMAAMCYITNDCSGGIDAEMVRFVTKLNRFEMYANRYK